MPNSLIVLNSLSAILRHDVGKCVCMCLIDDLKLNHSRILLYIAHQIFSLLIYPTKLPKPKSYLSAQFKRKKKIPLGVSTSCWWWEASLMDMVTPQISLSLSLSLKCFVSEVVHFI